MQGRTDLKIKIEVEGLSARIGGAKHIDHLGERLTYAILRAKDDHQYIEFTIDCRISGFSDTNRQQVEKLIGQSVSK